MTATAKKVFDKIDSQPYDGPPMVFRDPDTDRAYIIFADETKLPVMKGADGKWLNNMMPDPADGYANFEDISGSSDAERLVKEASHALAL